VQFYILSKHILSCNKHVMAVSDNVMFTEFFDYLNQNKRWAKGGSPFKNFLMTPLNNCDSPLEGGPMAPIKCLAWTNIYLTNLVWSLKSNISWSKIVTFNTFLPSWA